MARPKKKTQDYPVPIRMTEADKKAMDAEMKRRGISTRSDLMRSLIRGAADQPLTRVDFEDLVKKAVKEVIQELRPKKKPTRKLRK